MDVMVAIGHSDSIKDATSTNPAKWITVWKELQVRINIVYPIMRNIISSAPSTTAPNAIVPNLHSIFHFVSGMALLLICSKSMTFIVSYIA